MNGYAEGWFVVAKSDEIQTGDVKPLEYFGRDLVAYRSENQKIRVLDAFCPHLGAHLGMGGKVVGEAIQCPFHAWCYGPGGKCTSIPYAKKIPPKARVRSWQTQEVDGHVFVWHPRENQEPTYDVPALEGHDTDEWQGWTTEFLQIQSTPWDIVENLADKAHFPVIHQAAIEYFENEFHPFTAIQRTKGKGIDEAFEHDTSFESVATYYGPSYLITDMDATPEHRLLLTHTPVNETTVDLRLGVSLRKKGKEEWLEQMGSLVVKTILKAVEDDIAVWRHKTYRDRPVLSDADGPIGQLRKWYRRFYAGSEPATETTA